MVERYATSGRCTSSGRCCPSSRASWCDHRATFDGRSGVWLCAKRRRDIGRSTDEVRALRLWRHHHRGRRPGRGAGRRVAQHEPGPLDLAMASGGTHGHATGVYPVHGLCPVLAFRSGWCVRPSRTHAVMQVLRAVGRRHTIRRLDSMRPRIGPGSRVRIWKTCTPTMNVHGRYCQDICRYTRRGNRRAAWPITSGVAPHLARFHMNPRQAAQAAGPWSDTVTADRAGAPCSVLMRRRRQTARRLPRQRGACAQLRLSLRQVV